MYGMLRAVVISWLLIGSSGAQTTNPQNRAIEQGKTSPEDTGRLRTRERLDEQSTATARGVLVDAACSDRSAENLAQAPQAPVLAPAQPRRSSASGTSDKGITVDAKTLTGERADVMQHQVADLRARAGDLTCAITGATKAFAILLDDGRLLNLDEAGNTLALEAIQSSSAGRAMLNGNGPALKPKVTVKGIIHGDRLLVSQIVREGT